MPHGFLPFCIPLLPELAEQGWRASLIEAGAPGAKREPDRAKPQLMVGSAKRGSDLTTPSAPSLHSAHPPLSQGSRTISPLFSFGRLPYCYGAGQQGSSRYSFAKRGIHAHPYTLEDAYGRISSVCLYRIPYHRCDLGIAIFGAVRREKWTVAVI